MIVHAISTFLLPGICFVGLTRTRPKAKNRVDDRARYDDENQSEDNAGNDPQIVDCTRQRRLWIERTGGVHRQKAYISYVIP